MQDDGGALVTGGQVHRRHRPDTLSVHDHVLWPYTVPEKTATINMLHVEGTTMEQETTTMKMFSGLVVRAVKELTV